MSLVGQEEILSLDFVTSASPPIATAKADIVLCEVSFVMAWVDGSIAGAPNINSRASIVSAYQCFHFCVYAD